MGRILLAFRLFFAILFDAALAERVRRAADGDASPATPPTTQPEKKQAASPQSKPPARSEALTLLAALQHDARLVDFVLEPIDAYSDAQIGAAVREVHRGCATTLARLFALQPVVSQCEGEAVDVPADFDAERYRLTGKVVDQPPYQGRLVHHGWQATKCELPTWNGSDKAARIVAPAEVEIS